jgi:hypothetical protein
MNNVTLYTDYFRQLAVNHYLLKHNPDSETSDSNADKHFAKWTFDELVTGLRTKVKGNALYLEMFEHNLNAQTPHDVRLLASGAMSVVVPVTEGATTRVQEQAYALAYQIMIELLQRIYTDHYGKGKERCTTPFEQFIFDKDLMQPIGPVVENHYGWRIEFDFRFRSEEKISQPPAPGVFLDRFAPLGVPGEFVLDDENGVLAIFY